MMDLSHFMNMAGEDWEIRRAGQLVGTAQGIRRTERGKVDFLPGTDVQEGDAITGSLCKKTYQVTRTDVVTAHGQVFSVEAYFGEGTKKGGRGHTVNIGTAVGSPIMLDSPGASQRVSMTFTAESAVDLKVIIKGLLGALDELGLTDPDKEMVKEDAEYIKRKLDGGRAEPGLIRECLTGIRKKLVEAAAAAASSQIVTQAGHYAGLVTDFLKTTLGG